MAKLRVTQIRNGKKITFLTPDKGKPGRTPKEKRFFAKGIHTGWGKGMPMDKRRRLVLNAHKGDALSSARAMQSLANVTTDRETKQAARADAVFFFSQHKGKPSPRQKVGVMGNLHAIHASRSPAARAADESKRHSNVISPTDTEAVNRWKKNPGASDIRGIDTPRKRMRITPKTPKLRK